MQDTGVIQGISEAPQTFRFPRWRSVSRRWRHVILKDPAVESLSSFIGVDGTNTTLNSGRIQINLKPLDEARRQRHRRHPPTAAEAGARSTASRSTCSRSRISRSKTASAARSISTRLEDPDADELNTGRRGSSSKLHDAAPTCATSPATSRTAACRPTWSSTATTASRSASRPQTIDDTLYDAFGQRQISTMFTQLNQYHVILEAQPEFQQRSRTRCKTSTCVRPTGDAGAA